jgi:hypothetical protein
MRNDGAKGSPPMKIQIVRITMLLALVSSTFLNACATVAHGKYQKVPVLSSPAGAEVFTDCGKGPESKGPTPIVVKLDRKADRCVITLKKDGYDDTSAIVQRHLSGWFWCNIFLPYVTVPGALVDLYDGAAYKQAPGSVKVTLTPSQEASVTTSR